MLFLLKLLVEIFLLFWEKVDAAQRVKRSMASSFGIGRSLLWLAKAPFTLSISRSKGILVKRDFTSNDTNL